MITRPHHSVQRVRSAGSSAFSLLEMMVSLSIVAVLTVLVAQIVGLSSKAIVASSRNLAGASGARLVLDRLKLDFAGRPSRRDVPVSLAKYAGNDILEFYSAVKGYSGERGISAVSYRVQETNPDRLFQLERGVLGTSWGSGTELELTTQTIPTVSDTDYDVMSDGVFRFEFCYLKSDGTLSNTAKADLSDVAAIVVALATIDTSNRKVLKTGDLSMLSLALPDCTDGQTPLQAWSDAMSQTNFNPGVPATVIQAIRLHQRFYYVP